MSEVGEASPLIFLVAGEPSGDALGAGLMRALVERLQGRVRFAGVGGEQMSAAGLTSLFPLEDLAVLGVAEVLPRLRLLRRRIGDTVSAALRAEPTAVVTIDSFGFNARVARGLRRAGARFPLVHYVAPTVWVWRPWRAA